MKSRLFLLICLNELLVNYQWFHPFYQARMKQVHEELIYVFFPLSMKNIIWTWTYIQGISYRNGGFHGMLQIITLKFTISILNTLYTYLNKVGGSLYVIEIKWSFSRHWTIKPRLQKSCPFRSEFVGSPLIRLANSCNARKDSLKKNSFLANISGDFIFEEE